MDRVVRKFARRVVAIHAAVLVLLLVIVGIASREIYDSAREQALAQAKEGQALLAAQTARGIEGFYTAILAGLDLVREADAEPEAAAAADANGGAAAAAAAAAAPDPAATALDDAADRVTTRPASPAARRLIRDPMGPRALVFSRLIARQLEGRASQVFVLDRRTKQTFAVGEADRALPPGDVVAQLGDWFADVEGSQISPFRVRDGVGYNVAAVPARRNADLMIVATVHVRAMESRMLDRIDQERTVASMLADDARVVMAANERSWVGRDLESLGGPGGRVMLAVRQDGFRTTQVIADPFRVGDVDVPPAMFATEPVRVADRQWFLLIASDLTRVDAALTSLVRHGAVWVVFVILSVTALLVSTSVQLIRNRMRLERERNKALETELANARQIQLAWLPKAADAGDRLDLAAVNEPASHISGDFYNWFELPDGRTAVVIGDVTGHGMSAAFFMATVQLLVRNTLPQTMDPGRCLTEVNRQLCVQAFNGQFVTIQVLVIDRDARRLEMANAGHPPPLTGDGESFQPLKLEPQLVLGIEPSVEYPTERFELPPGAAVLLYTDGVLDAVTVEGKRFESDGLQRSVYGRYESAAGLVRAVIEAVTAFRGERELVDDLTLVAVQLQPSAAGAGAPPAKPVAV